MATVNSVLGPVTGDKLGFTLVHEHVSVSSAGIPQVFPEFIDRQGTIDVAVKQLRSAFEEGVRTIVDVTTMDLGRDIRLLEEVSRLSGVQIIPCTGTWLDIPRVLGAASPDVVADLYTREIDAGIEGTGIRAGIIKVANDATGVSREGEVILRAAARASLRTGVRITTHTDAQARIGEQQIRIFEDEGVDLPNVCIGHSNNTTDTDYLIGIAAKGAYVGMDHYPGGRRPGTPNWEERTSVLSDLIKAGVGDRLLLSHDNLVTVTPANREEREQRLQYNPDVYSFVSRKVLPRLRELGVTDKAIHDITVENPRRFLTGS